MTGKRGHILYKNFNMGIGLISYTVITVHTFFSDVDKISK